MPCEGRTRHAFSRLVSRFCLACAPPTPPLSHTLTLPPNLKIGDAIVSVNGKDLHDSPSFAESKQLIIAAGRPVLLGIETDLDSTLTDLEPVPEEEVAPVEQPTAEVAAAAAAAAAAAPPSGQLPEGSPPAAAAGSPSLPTRAGNPALAAPAPAVDATETPAASASAATGPPSLPARQDALAAAAEATPAPAALPTELPAAAATTGGSMVESALAAAGSRRFSALQREEEAAAAAAAATAAVPAPTPAPAAAVPAAAAPAATRAMVEERSAAAVAASAPATPAQSTRSQFAGSAAAPAPSVDDGRSWSASSPRASASPRTKTNPSPRRDQQVSRAGLSSSELDEIHEAFCLFDADGSGTISLSELQEGFASIGRSGGAVDSIARAVQDIDHSGDGEIDFTEFLDLMTSSGGAGSVMSRLASDEIFNLFVGCDPGGNGALMTSNTLQRIFRELGDPIPLSDIDELVSYADHENKGGITSEEFYVMIALGPTSRDAERYYDRWQRSTGRGIATE